MDREKIMSALHCRAQDLMIDLPACDKCDYQIYMVNRNGCDYRRLCKDSISLLKEQESVVRKPVVGYEGIYEVDNFGRVFSLDRVKQVDDNGRIYDKPLTGKRMKQHTHTKGYKVVSLTKDGKTKTCFVHRIVAEAFIDNPSNLPMINHKDEDRTNNEVDNLEWCDVRYNMMYGHAREKRRKKLVGRPHSEEHKKKISEGIKRHYAEKHKPDWFCADAERKTDDDET